MILQSAVLEINLKNLIYNYKYLSSLNKGSYTAAIIKANAYGLGDITIIKKLYKIGCKHFFVATIDEAINLRKNFRYGYIFVLNGLRKKEINNYIIKNNIIPIINSIEKLKEVTLLNKKIKIAIHIDTGINRLGIQQKDIKKILNFKNINVKLVLSHLASADENGNNYSNKQISIFKKITDKYFKNVLKSISNSAGIKTLKNSHFDMIRPGIALYGGHNNTLLKKYIKPVIKLKAEILQIKDIKKNEFVGYNQTFISRKKMKIAIIGIGYADGILRSLSNNYYVYYKKYRFKIIGRISMDSITIDISKSKNLLKTGMMVELINYENDIEKIAKKCGTISNEILTSISQRVKRVYIK